MKQYIWQLSQWTNFFWDEKRLLPLISSARLKQGRLIQKIQNLLESEAINAEAIIWETETIKTAQIEGEIYDPKSVRSSINRHLGLAYAGLPKTERHIEGLVEVLFDATLHHDQPLTRSRLYSWHAALFPTGYSGLIKIQVGQFRTDKTGPMQVISGPIGKEQIHYEAPAANKVPKEIETFLNWWKISQNHVDGIIRAGIAHFYFITIHPFDDGNGRIARALADMALAQDDKLTKRYYSLSTEIVKDKKKYYAILEQSQQGRTDITDWLVWFINCFSQALDASENLLANIFLKTEFWKKHGNTDFNFRQKKVINILLDAGKGNFIGGLTTRKYVGLTKTSRATAIREINDLLSKQILTQNAAKGRSVNYDLNFG